MPPLARRCPECGHLGRTSTFRVVGDDDAGHLVECPACHGRFAPVDDPHLA